MCIMFQRFRFIWDGLAGSPWKLLENGDGRGPGEWGAFWMIRWLGGSLAITSVQRVGEGGMVGRCWVLDNTYNWRANHTLLRHGMEFQGRIALGRSKKSVACSPGMEFYGTVILVFFRSEDVSFGLGGEEKGNEAKGQGGFHFWLGTFQTAVCFSLSLSSTISLLESPKHHCPMNEKPGRPNCLALFIRWKFRRSPTSLEGGCH
jgi:hypothetical protein